MAAAPPTVPAAASPTRSAAQWVVLAVTADGSPVDRDRLVAKVVDARKFAAADVEAAIAGLAADGALSVESGQVAVTATGQEVRRRIRARIDEVTSGLFDFPADDLATAGRVLATVTERANAFLASHTGS